MWIQTRTGRALDLLNPDPATIDLIGDVAPALALINRFNGHAGLHFSGFSVAQHSLLGADAILTETGNRELATAFLLHDAHEFALGDMTSPVSDALAMLVGAGFRFALGELKRRMDEAICARLGLAWPWPESINRAVKAWDLRMLHAERAVLMGPPPKPWDSDSLDVAPIATLGWRELVPMSPKEAQREWLLRLGALIPSSLAAS